MLIIRDDGSRRPNSGRDLKVLSSVNPFHMCCARTYTIGHTDMPPRGRKLAPMVSARNIFGKRNYFFLEQLTSDFGVIVSFLFDFAFTGPPFRTIIGLQQKTSERRPTDYNVKRGSRSFHNRLQMATAAGPAAPFIALRNLDCLKKPCNNFLRWIAPYLSFVPSL